MWPGRTQKYDNRWGPAKEDQSGYVGKTAERYRQQESIYVFWHLLVFIGLVWVHKILMVKSIRAYERRIICT